METALGRLNRMETLLTMAKKGHPNSSVFLEKPEVVALFKARELLIAYNGIKKRNLFGHSKNVWFFTLSRSLANLKSFAKPHDDSTKDDLPYFNEIPAVTEPWQKIPVIETDLKEPSELGSHDNENNNK
jgi:hypothetical protein